MCKILLVDDDESFRKMIRLTLLKLGYDVTEAANGKQARQAFAAGPVDVLLTDLIMPDQEGLETIQEFRHAHPTVKIIAMSGGGRINAVDFLKIARMMGAQQTLAKPFSNQELSMAIENVLARPAGRHEAAAIEPDPMSAG